MIEEKTAPLEQQEDGTEARVADWQPAVDDSTIKRNARQGSLASCIPRGRENAITAAELSALSGLERRHVMTLIRRARLDGVPICSDNTGFWVAETSAEIKECAARLRLRASEIDKAARAMQKQLTGSGKTGGG